MSQKSDYYLKNFCSATWNKVVAGCMKVANINRKMIRIRDFACNNKPTAYKLQNFFLRFVYSSRVSRSYLSASREMKKDEESIPSVEGRTTRAHESP